MSAPQDNVPSRVAVPFTTLVLVIVGVVGIAVAVPGDQRAGIIAVWVGMAVPSGLGAAVFARVGHVKDAVGPRNGENVQEGIRAIHEFQHYQATRNHRIVNLLTVQNGMMREALRALGVEWPDPPPDPDADN